MMGYRHLHRHVTRVSNSRNNQRGQALLLAIVLMLLIALVGAAFISVISASLSRSEQQEDRVATEKAAQEGVQYANDQLMNHPSGADWRPSESAAPILGPSDPLAPDDVETQRGWTRLNGFFKFKARESANAYFILRMRSIPFDPNLPLSRFIEITSVGRTLNNAGIFKILTAYKPVGITDYARLFTEYSSSTRGFKQNVVTLGAPPAIDYDADALVIGIVSPTEIVVSDPETFSEGDTILIGRDPNNNGVAPGAPDPFNNKVGVREPAAVSTVDLTTQRITLAAPLTFVHELGEPIVVGQINAGAFERKVTIGRLVRSVDVVNDSMMFVASARKAPSTLVQNNDTVFIGLNNAALNRTEHSVVVTSVDNTVNPPQIDFTSLVAGTPNSLHEKGEPVRIFVPQPQALNSLVNPYEQLAAAVAADQFQETEFARTVIRGPIHSNSDLRFFGNLLLFLDPTRGDRLESARTITYDIADNPATPPPLLEGADSTGIPIGHPSDTSVNNTAIRIADSGSGGVTFVPVGVQSVQVSADGIGRLNRDPTQPLRQVRPLTPPLIAREGLPSSNPGVAGGFRFQRYEEPTRHSDPRRPNSNVPTLGEMGYGKGIFIDNFADVQFAPLGFNFAQRRQNLIDQWLQKPLNQWTQPAPTPDPTQDSDGTPQWVNNGLEYVPKGVQIIVRNDDVVWDPSTGQFVSLGNAAVHPTTGAPHVPGRPVLWIIRSATPPLRVDGTPVLLWTADSRVRIGPPPGTPMPLYFTSFDYPENGVILAAGNVRIQGNLPPSYPNTTTANVLNGNITAGDRDYNLTVVSGGTIYIEGNILTPKDIAPGLFAVPADNVHNTHIALLAKDHVCLNTTQFYAPLAAGTVVQPPAPNPPLPLLHSFSPAEFATMPSQILDAANIRSFWNMPAGSPTPATVMRQFSLGEPYLLTNNANTTARLAVAMRHGGRRQEGLTVRSDPNDGPAQAELYLTNPLNPAPPEPVMLQPPDFYKPTDLFLDTDQVSLKDANGIYKPIGTVASDINMIQVMGNAKYQASANAAVTNASSEFLARLGRDIRAGANNPLNRRDESVTAPFTRTEDFVIPMITRALLLVNSVPPTNPSWLIGNPSDPFALFEFFYQNPLNRPQSGEPPVQQLASQSVLDPPITLSPNNNLTGSLHEIRFMAEPDPTFANVLADYRLSRFKMEQYLPGVDPLTNTAVIRPTWGLTIKVNALIYAQEGSWFVIPGPYFDTSALNDDTRPGLGNAIRYRRYNYRVLVNGAVVENHTADDFPVTMGNRNVYTFNSSKWEERIAYPALTPNVNTGLFDPPYTWQGIEYQWDAELKNFRWAVEDLATGNIKPVLKIPKLPMGPDLIFIG